MHSPRLTRSNLQSFASRIFMIGSCLYLVRLGTKAEVATNNCLIPRLARLVLRGSYLLGRAVSADTASRVISVILSNCLPAISSFVTIQLPPQASTLGNARYFSRLSGADAAGGDEAHHPVRGGDRLERLEPADRLGGEELHDVQPVIQRHLHVGRRGGAGGDGNLVVEAPADGFRVESGRDDETARPRRPRAWRYRGSAPCRRRRAAPPASPSCGSTPRPRRCGR